MARALEIYARQHLRAMDLAYPRRAGTRLARAAIWTVPRVYQQRTSVQRDRTALERPHDKMVVPTPDCKAVPGAIFTDNRASMPRIYDTDPSAARRRAGQTRPSGRVFYFALQ